MLCVLLIGLLIVAVAFSGLLLHKQTRTIEDLKRAREELQLEESRVFDFLHGLGETFTGDVRVADLHRLMVEGAMRILDAHGGALYVADRSGFLVQRLSATGRCSSADSPTECDHTDGLREFFTPAYCQTR